MSGLRNLVLILLCVALAGCGLNQAREEATSSTELLVLEQEVHELVNEYRDSQKLPRLSYDDTIAHHARIHSQNMADGRVAFGHRGFDGRLKMIAGHLSYSAAAENVAYNNQAYSDCAAFAVDGWIESPGHRENIEGDYRLTGVGIALDSDGVYYFTQIFWQ